MTANLKNNFMATTKKIDFKKTNIGTLKLKKEKNRIRIVCIFCKRTKLKDMGDLLAEKSTNSKQRVMQQLIYIESF